ncbi:MAG TPA: glycoside hydrolase family 127 protein [Candidatus Latescibacteria bacterium]|nr:glycoside hydrolase family 127 protein [Candidatus Latescibacterota bacterium]
MPQSKQFAPRDVVLEPGLFRDRYELNRRYVMSLKNENLLQNHYLEARLWQTSFRNTHNGETGWGEDRHWGWESPTCQVRGQFLGHWLSAAARIAETGDDYEVRAKLNRVVAELARCQQANGGEWVASIPPSYLEWTAKGQPTWAPHYVVHKTLMGLFDAFAVSGNEQALQVLSKAAKWFVRWTSKFDRDTMNDILDTETGGMLELWANLYGVTGKQEHLDLVYRYDRPRLFDRLLNGEDPLTNQHANTTIPEAHGAARAWEVTGDERWRRIVEAYWECAVTNRGYFCTGGQTCGEVWTPPYEFSARLGDKNQEHCTVYNMMRLADYLFRWTGDAQYVDYIERNLYNGILAQQNPSTGMVSYFLPLRAGGKKRWGSPTNDFWCCHGTLVQAHTLHNAYGFYKSDDGLILANYIPSSVTWRREGGVVVRARQTLDTEVSARSLPKRLVVNLTVSCSEQTEFPLQVRVPWWVAGEMEILADGVRLDTTAVTPSSFVTIRRAWKQETIRIVIPQNIRSSPIPDMPGTVAFMDGPAVLAGLVHEERRLTGNKNEPNSFLTPDNEREWTTWRRAYRTTGQLRGVRFVPLHTIEDETYTVYFPVEEPR